MKELLICVLSFMVFTIILYMLWEARERKRKESDAYVKRYAKIDWMINTYQVNDLNYDFLLIQLKCLGNMKHRNRKRTSMLTRKFILRYLRVAAAKRAQEKMIKQN